MSVEVFEPTGKDGDLLVRKNYALTEAGNRQASLSLKSLPPRTRRAVGSLTELNDFSSDALVSYVHHEFPEESGLVTLDGTKAPHS
ncbi:MAG: hypothetical protein WB778_04155 [Thermoplasmata archaeon]